MSSLNAIVRAYISQIRPRAKEELDWFKQMPTLSVTIEHAALAINSIGKRYSHQRRLKKATLQRAKAILLANLRRIKQCRNFDELFTLIEVALQGTGGIGELYVYDTALRIGAKLNLLPRKVYLHAGTRVGARAIGFYGTARILRVSDLPKELQRLKPHEIEDTLCIFKSDLGQATFKSPDHVIIKRSWCD